MKRVDKLICGNIINNTTMIRNLIRNSVDINIELLLVRDRAIEHNLCERIKWAIKKLI